MKIFTSIFILLLFVSVNAQDLNYTKTKLGQDRFGVNELYMVPDSGRSGQPIKISYTINNEDQFSAFQFDIILPSVLTFVQDSVWLFRKVDHVIIANLVNQNTLRILAYSLSNQPFTGNDGEIVRVMFNLNGSAGTYNVGLNNVVITSPIGVNILSGVYPGFIKITAPDINGQTDIDFGEVSVLDTLSYNYELSNTGNDTLFVTEFSSSETYFWNTTSLPQNIPPGESKTFNLKFHNIIKGQYSTTYTIRSNDPDEDPFYVNASAISFAPNYILIRDAEAYVRDTVTLKIDVKNYEQFIDFQVDFDFPTNLTYVNNSAALTNRKQDHILFVNTLSSNKIRLFSYSANQLPFLGDTGTVATMNFVVGNDTGTFPLHLSGGILWDYNSENIIKGTIDGEIHIQKRPSFQLAVTVTNGWNMVSVPGYNPDGQGVNNWWSGRDPVADVFKYVSGYQIITTAIPGEGYWMKHLGTNTYNTGDEWPSDGIEIVPHNPVNAVAGWNLIGGYEDTVQTADLTTTPPGLITGPIYGYSGGYNIVSELFPGYAYWVKLTSAGQINFPTAASKQKTQIVNYFNENWGRIVITDAKGNNFILYAVNENINLDQYELPPIPPQGSFDVRFSSGRITEDIYSCAKMIELSGVTYPLTIKAENIDIQLRDETGKLINLDLKKGEDVVINDATINKLMVAGALKPDKYSLEQNYPNPFNPSTVIEFSLPENVSSVKLTIYNLLGEKVAELVNASLTAGKYSYQWNASNAATGMYIYELRTGKFISIKKMLLLK